ncbi:hypothetical protein A6X20_17460 [Bradyrhizobium elkanii]|nr:hypothetical protein A6X20_17460 [Bradyrhizobium elkanii]
MASGSPLQFEMQLLAVIHHRDKEIRLPAAGAWPISTRRYSHADCQWCVDGAGTSERTALVHTIAKQAWW